MSSTHVFRVQDVCARLHVVDVALETSASPSSKESCPKPGTGPLPTPTLQVRSDSATTRAAPPFKETLWDQKTVAPHQQQLGSWPSPGSPIVPLALDLVYGFWYADAEESRIALLPLESCLDGDIFGVGKRPVQREIEKDGCIRLQFVEE